MMTPFSGLSLFLHLAIIASAKVIGFVRRDMLSAVYNRGPQATGKTRRFLNKTISITIVVFISTTMLSFVGIAITTGVREGEAESHIEFIESTITAIGNGRTYFYSREADAPQYSVTPTPEKETAASKNEDAAEPPEGTPAHQTPANTAPENESTYPTLVISI